MGGTSTSSQTQSSTTAPWQQAQPAINGILGQLQPLVSNSGLNGTESGAINQLTQNAQAGNPYAGQIGNLATNELNGGGANQQAPALQSGLSTLQSQLTPYANGSMVGNNPALQDELQAINTQVGNSVNSQFAGAGRSFSGANQQAYGYGVGQAEAPVIANQYNQDVQNQLSAANTLYGAQNTTSGALAGLNQQGLSNQQQGATTAGQALQAQNYGPTATLAAQQLAQSIPAQNLGLLAQIGIPIAGLGSQSTGQSNGSQTMSPIQQITSLGGLLGSGGGTAANGAVSNGSGILGLLGML